MISHVIIDLVLIFLIICFFIILHFKQLKNEKIYKDLYDFLDKNFGYLGEMYKRKTESELRNSIHVFSQFQIIQKISNADYVTLFKYNYSKKIVELDFVFSLDNNGHMIQESLFNNLTFTGNVLTLDAFKSINCDLCDLDLDEFEHKCPEIYNIMESRNLKRIYFKNIFKDDRIETPIAFMVISYKENYNINIDDKEEIKRIIKTMREKIDSSFYNVPSSINIEKEKPAIRKRLNIRFWLVLIFSLLFASLTFRILYVDNINGIFNRYFQPIEIFSAPRGELTLFDRGVIEYNNKNYIGALSIFREILKENDENDVVIFYAGSSYLFLDNPNESLNYLNKIEENSPLRDSARWLTVACYLKNKDLDSAKLILGEISHDSDSSFYTEAFELLNSLD